MPSQELGETKTTLPSSGLWSSAKSKLLFHHFSMLGREQVSSLPRCSFLISAVGIIFPPALVVPNMEQTGARKEERKGDGGEKEGERRGGQRDGREQEGTAEEGGGDMRRPNCPENELRVKGGVNDDWALSVSRPYARSATCCPPSGLLVAGCLSQIFIILPGERFHFPPLQPNFR